jgi:hypothetical protein
VEQPGVRAETLEPAELVGAAGPDDEKRRLQPLDQLGGLVRVGRIDDRPPDTVERAADRPTPVRIVVENNDVQVRRIVRREDPPTDLLPPAQAYERSHRSQRMTYRFGGRNVERA